MAKTLRNTGEKLWKWATNLKAPFHLDNQISKAGSGRKVYLLGRQLASGNISLFRYAFVNGRRQRESLGRVLKLEVDANIQRANEEILRLAVLSNNALNESLEVRGTKFIAQNKKKQLLVDYIIRFADNEHTSPSMRRQLRALAGHLTAAGQGAATFAEITEQWTRSFVSYLKYDAKSLKSQKPLAPSSAAHFCTLMHTILRKAMTVDKLISQNYMDLITSSEKPRNTPSRARVYLDVQELQTLANTPVKRSQMPTKNAFLFAAFTGLRMSDIRQLTWGNILEDAHGAYIWLTMQKTKRQLKVYIPEHAMKYLGSKKEGPIFSLPTPKAVSSTLGKWAKAAGIDKHVTFHSGRHTAATLLLSNGTPLATVQRQLGHTHIGTTEIYAHILADEQARAARTLDSLFSEK